MAKVHKNEDAKVIRCVVGVLKKAFKRPIYSPPSNNS